MKDFEGFLGTGRWKNSARQRNILPHPKQHLQSKWMLHGLCGSHLSCRLKTTPSMTNDFLNDKLRILVETSSSVKKTQKSSIILNNLQRMEAATINYEVLDVDSIEQAKKIVQTRLKSSK